MAVDLGRTGNTVKSLQRRYVGTTNISDVYTGQDHIWPTKTISFVDFTSIQLRYIWNSSDGRDYDTATWYSNSPVSSMNGYKVGWSWNSSYAPYIYWGGDNTSSGAECVMLNIEAFNEAGYGEQMPDTLMMYFDGNWFGTRGSGNVTIECTAYKGGFIVRSYQLSVNDINFGQYLFAGKDGDLQVTVDGEVKNCYYGPVLVITKDGNSTYHKINQLDLTVDRFDVSTIGGLTYYYNDPDIEPGYTIYNGAKYQVWNEQINVSGVITTVGSMVFKASGDTIYTSDDGTKYQLTHLMLGPNNESLGYEKAHHFQFGFTAGGNSEFRGQQVIAANCSGDDSYAADTSMGEISYKNSTKIGVLKVYNPINQE